MEVEKVYKILSMMVNVEQIQILFDQHPDKFDYQIRKQFIGAVCSDKVENLKAVQLL